MGRVVLAIIISAFALTALGQPAPVTIRGRVIADESGDAIPNARVAIASSAVGAPVVLTDSDGQFSLGATISALPVHLAASKTGYARREVTRPAAIPSQPIEIRLQHGAVVSGRIVNAFGDPIPDVRVAAQLAAQPDRRPPDAAAGARAPAVAATTTDDLGEYRLSSLPAGAYVIATTTFGAAAASPIGNNQVMYQPEARTTYYPGVGAPADAQVLRLEPGEERPRTDFVVPDEQTVFEPISLAPQGPPAVFTFMTLPKTAQSTGIVRGRVVSTDGRGLAHAQVRLITVGNGMLQSAIGRADADARFELRDLPSARFSILAAKTGYSLAAVVPPFDLAGGETREGIDVTLARWGTLEGHVVDDLGEPIQGARAQVLQVRYENARRRLVPAANAARLTDDLGRFRLHGLPPGRYVVSASVSEVGTAEVPGYARAYYPSTSNAADAQFVSVGLSQDITGIDIPLSRAPTARVAGRLIDAAGAPATGGSLNLLPSQGASSAIGVPLGARIQPDGQFEFPNVAPGQYVVQSARSRSSPWREGEFGSLSVSVTGTDVTGLVIQTSTGSTIKGRFRFDARDRVTIPARSAIELSPIPVDSDLSPKPVASADIHDDWTFDIAGVNGPRRLQLVRVPPGWALQEIRVNGADATDRPLPFGRTDQSLRDVEVVLTDRVSELSGKVVTDREEAVAEAAVVIFATDRGRWYPVSRFLRTASASGGTFSALGLPFGTYYVVAVPHLPQEGPGDTDAWQDPDFLNAVVPFASTITIRDGEKQTITLHLAAR
ncbi:MAG TPA: carboxypeptidase-like regulatory domain-containing protein [Vicinamibacterales bacterium]|nr:carboxypeptidase-like regulatory domain-containing protein [Vicinamibacterales bacterium]